MPFFGIPIGVDFLDATTQGFVDRYSDWRELGAVKIIANSGRAAQNIRDAFLRGYGFAPKIYTLPSFMDEELIDPSIGDVPSEMSQVLGVAALLSKIDQGLYPLEPVHRFELAFNLVDLMKKCAERGRTPEDLLTLDGKDFAEHWRLNAELFQILTQYWRDIGGDLQAHAEQAAMERLAAQWQSAPPSAPIYIVGSTGSRPIMRRLMGAVNEAGGGIVLPAFDFEPQAELGEDHPQYGMQNLLAHFDAPPVEIWAGAPTPIGNFLRTAMAPPPYTDLWLRELGGMHDALSRADLELTWLESKTAQDEIKALVVAIYDAVEAGRSVMLVSSDRAQVRRLTKRLTHLGIEYDESAGKPLALAPSAVFAALTLDALMRKDRVSAVALLSHPFVMQLEDRAEHLLALRRFEKHWLRATHDERAWAADLEDEKFAKIAPWIEHWRGYFDTPIAAQQSLRDWVKWHLGVMREAIGGDGDFGKLKSGDERDLKFFTAMQELASLDDGQNAMSLQEYVFFWRAWLARNPSLVLKRNEGALVNILGVREARTESADLVIFAAMNEGQWPDAEIPDMWLNRSMRKALGLETPERFIGLAAHDFLTGFSARHLVLSRALKSDDAPNIESRFLTRLRVLMTGANAEYFEEAQARGAALGARAKAFDAPRDFPPLEPRPAIVMRKEARPQSYSVTDIEAMLKNPYRAYAKSVLKLYELAPLSDQFGASELGNIAHAIFEAQSEAAGSPPRPLDEEGFDQTVAARIAQEGLNEAQKFDVEMRFDALRTPYLAEENERRAWAARIDVEDYRECEFERDGMQMMLRARFDRLDVNAQGDWRLYDYKPGGGAYSAQTFTSQKAVQLPLMSMMMQGEFGRAAEEICVLKYGNIKNGLSARLVHSGNSRKFLEFDPAAFGEEFDEFLGHYYAADFAFVANDQGAHGFDQGYEHLARFGEWLPSDSPKSIEVGHE